MNSPPFASRLRWRASWAPPTCGSVMNKPAVNILAPAPCPGACRVLRLGQQGARVSQEPETRLSPRRKRRWYHHPSEAIAGGSQTLALSDLSHRKPVVMGCPTRGGVLTVQGGSLPGRIGPGEEDPWRLPGTWRGCAHGRRHARPGTGILPACPVAVGGGEGVLRESPRGPRCSRDLCISG